MKMSKYLRNNVETTRNCRHYGSDAGFCRHFLPLALEGTEVAEVSSTTGAATAGVLPQLKCCHN